MSLKTDDRRVELRARTPRKLTPQVSESLAVEEDLSFAEDVSDDGASEFNNSSDSGSDSEGSFLDAILHRSASPSRQSRKMAARATGRLDSATSSARDERADDMLAGQLSKLKLYVSGFDDRTRSAR